MPRQPARRNEQETALEKNILHAQRFCRKLLEALDEPALILDADLLILHVNSILVKELEYSADDLKGAPLGILLAEVDCEQLARYLAQKDSENLYWSETTQCHRLDGIAYPAHVEISLAEKAPKNARFYQCQISRTSDQSMTINAGSDAQADFYRELVGTLPDIVYQRKLDGGLIFVSSIVKSLLGYSPGEMSGMIQEYLSDHPMNDPYLDLVDNASSTVVPFEPVVCEFHHKNGGSIFLQVRENLIFGANGKPRFVQGMLQVPPESEIDKKHATHEIHYDQIFHNLKFGLWVEDLQGTILDANQELLHLLDYDGASIKSLTHNDLLAPDRILDFQGRVNRLDEGASIELESMALDSQSRRIPVELVINSVKLEHETVRLVQVREAGKQHALSRILKSQNLELAVCNSILKHMQFKDRAESIYGAALGELIRALKAEGGIAFIRSAGEWRRIELDREGRNAPELASEFPLSSGLLEQLQQQKVCIMRELAHDPARFFSPKSKRDGIQSAVAVLCAQEPDFEFAMLFLGTAYEHFNDHALRLIETIADLFRMAAGKRRHDAQRYPPDLSAEDILRNSPAPMLLFDEQGKIVYWNPACEAQFGLPRNEAEGKPLELLLGRRAGESSLASAIQNVFAGRKFTRLSGSAFGRNLLLNLYPASNADERVRKGVCMLETPVATPPAPQPESSEMPQAAAVPPAKPENAETLAEPDDLISFQDLAGGIGNDFNNQLNAIMGYASLLQNGLEPEDPQQDYLRLIQDACRRNSALAQQLLSWSGDAAFQPQPLNLNEIVEAVLPQLRERLDPQIRLLTRLSPHMADFEGNPQLIEQCLLNLCRFAGEAMPAGGRLSLETFLRSLAENELPEGSELQAGKYAILRIQDQGHGLPEETRRKLFQPGAGRRQAEFGLGLAAVQRVMKNHFGEIAVHSVPGAGTRFDLYFPVEWTIETSPPLKVPASTVQGRALPCALIIDDNRTVRQVTRKMFEILGYELVEAENGLEGVRLVAAEPARFDLVLLDMMMPVMSGRETYECLRTLREDLPVIFISGYQVERIERRLELGPEAGYLQKPFTLNELERVLHNFLPVIQ